MVRSYALDIEAAADGTLYDVDGEPTIIDDIKGWKEKEWNRQKAEFLAKHPFGENPDNLEDYENEEEYVTYNIGDVDDIDPEQMSVTDYNNYHSLGDVRFEVNGKMELYGGKVLLACGGPTIWLADDEIRGYWGSDTETWSLCSTARGALMEFFQEEWDMACDSHSR